MKPIAVDLCLALAVAAAWLGALGFLRLRTPLDRLHCTTFVLSSSGPFIALAAVVDEGVTTRSLKIIFIVVTLLVAGAATSHAVGRALVLRDGPQA